MTVDQAIDRVDRLKCNAYTLREKRDWLAQVEGRIRREILDAADAELIIPMTAHCESLNAAVAASIVMWQMTTL